MFEEFGKLPLMTWDKAVLSTTVIRDAVFWAFGLVRCEDSMLSIVQDEHTAGHLPKRRMGRPNICN